MDATKKGESQSHVDEMDVEVVEEVAKVVEVQEIEKSFEELRFENMRDESLHQSGWGFELVA